MNFIDFINFIQDHWIFIVFSIFISNIITILIYRALSKRRKTFKFAEILYKSFLSDYEKLYNKHLLTTPINSMHELLLVTDVEDYKIVYANNNIKEKYGDIIGKTCYSILHKEDDPCETCLRPWLYLNKKPYLSILKNEKEGKVFIIMNVLKEINGRKLKFESLIDVTSICNDIKGFKLKD